MRISISMAISMNKKNCVNLLNPRHPWPINENNTIHHPKGIPANL